MWAFRLLAAFLFGCLYASAAWSLTLPCENCYWQVFPIVIVVAGGVAVASLIGIIFCTPEVAE